MKRGSHNGRVGFAFFFGSLWGVMGAGSAKATSPKKRREKKESKLSSSFISFAFHLRMKNEWSNWESKWKGVEWNWFWVGYGRLQAAGQPAQKRDQPTPINFTLSLSTCLYFLQSHYCFNILSLPFFRNSIFFHSKKANLFNLWIGKEKLNELLAWIERRELWVMGASAPLPRSHSLHQKLSLLIPLNLLAFISINAVAP